MTDINKIKQSLSDERGAVFVEMVISFLPFFIVLMVCISILRLAFYFTQVEYMANEALAIATEGVGPSNTVSRDPNCVHFVYDPPSPYVTDRSCMMKERLKKIANSDGFDVGLDAVKFDASSSSICSRTTAKTQKINTSTSSLDVSARDLVSICVSLDVPVIPIPLLDAISISVSGVAAGRVEEGV